MPPGDIVSRLAALVRFAGVPSAELEWLAARGEVREYAAGEILVDAGAAVDEMYLLLAGRAAVYVDKGGSWRKFSEAPGGEVLGAMPYSRGRTAPGRLAVEEASTVLAFKRAHFEDLQRNCPAITAALVSAMIDRSNAGLMSQLHEERLFSLGRLASGLAHELNNPASAATRGARSLGALLDEEERSARTLAGMRLTDAQLDVLDAVRACLAPASAHGVLELADREEAFVDWLERHGIEPFGADALAASSVQIADLDKLSAALPPSALGPAIRWVASGRAARALAAQVASATGRIHDLVGAVKRFTFMDREMVREDVDIAQGLVDTLAVLENKTQRLSVDVRLVVAPDLPRVHGFGSEINQVWEKLVDNAIDAAGASGHVIVNAWSRGDAVLVDVTDDGPGISEATRARIFDPFFTTKPIGQGTGLGLHLARRVVLFHKGDVSFRSEPGRTTFSVRLPAITELPKA